LVLGFEASEWLLLELLSVTWDPSEALAQVLALLMRVL